jgi:hypothetical protein
MSLDNKNKTYRVIWNYPRPVRTSRPNLIRSFIQVLFSDESFSTLIDQKDQREFDKMLQTLDLKRNTPKPRDKNPGGVRTIKNHLENLFLIWVDKESKIIYPTLAGDKLKNDEDIFDVMRSVILNAQFPSPAGCKSNVKMHPDIKIKNNIFLLNLLLDDEIRALSAEELFVPIIYGHNKKSFNLVKRKILEMRKGKSWIEVVDNPKTDLFTPRKEYFSEDDNATWYDYLFDIATTIIPLLRDVRLIQEYKNENGLRCIGLIESEIEFIKKSVFDDQPISYDSNYYESFQRRLGSYGKRDSRVLTVKSVYSKKEKIIKSMQNKFLIECQSKIVEELDPDMVEWYSKLYAVDESEVRKILSPLLDKCYTEFEQYLLMTSSSGPKKAIEFERMLIELFKQKFKFLCTHTGQLRRKKQGHNYSDILVVDENKNNAIIVDAKAIKEFSLPISDQDKMDAYINSFEELNDKFYKENKLDLFLCLFVAHTLKNTFHARAKIFSDEIGDIHCSGIDIIELIELSKKKNIGLRQNELISKLKISGTINSQLIN